MNKYYFTGNTTLTTSLDCKFPGMPREKSTLTCQVLNGKRDRIVWFRPDGKPILWCDYRNSICAVISSVRERYRGFVTGEYKNSLIIESFDPRFDAGYWSCQHGFEGVPSTCFKKVVDGKRERERNVLFNDALNTFFLRLYGVRHMVKDQSDSERGNPLPPHRLLLSINSKGSFICTIAP